VSRLALNLELVGALLLDVMYETDLPVEATDLGLFECKLEDVKLLLDLVRLLMLVASIFSLNLSFSKASFLELTEDLIEAWQEGAAELFLGVD